jgi:uncharacterized protein YndB with AHSA1/START domain
MVDILHRIGVQSSSPQAVYEALTTIEGLAKWWTEDTSGDTGVGGVIRFRFLPGGFDMTVRDLQPAARVLWEVTEGPDEWLGTEIDWQISQDGDYTIIMFEHRGWEKAVDFMYHCSTKWALFLMSLKALLETGEGAPAPRDVQISDWH